MNSARRNARARGIWRFGPAWARGICAAAPWLTVALLALGTVCVSVRFVRAPGVPFDLPRGTAAEAADAGLTVVMVPVPARNGDSGLETLAFFDDARFSLSDAEQTAALLSRFKEKAFADGAVSVLVIADSRVPSGDVAAVADIARQSGLHKVVLAEKPVSR